MAIVVTDPDKYIELWLGGVDLEEVEDPSVSRRCRFEKAEGGGRNWAGIAGRGRVVLWRASG